MTDKQPDALMYANKLQNVFGLADYANEMRLLHELNMMLIETLEYCSKTSYIRDAHQAAIRALAAAHFFNSAEIDRVKTGHVADARKMVSQCTRCGEVNPAEIHTCTPLDPLLEALRVPDYSKAGFGFASPQREWVGLTDEDRIDCETKAKGNYRNHSLFVEQALKEKNT